jgi:hypothetical protein
VILSQSQLNKLKRLGGPCRVYVNRYGEVCVRSLCQPHPTGGIVFGTVEWNESAPRDSDGYPLFQGVRGVRVVRDSPSDHLPPSLKERFTLWLQSLWSMAFTNELRERHNLLVRRQQRLKGELERIAPSSASSLSLSSSSSEEEDSSEAETWTRKARMERELQALRWKLKSSEFRQLARFVCFCVMSLFLLSSLRGP